MPDERQPDPRDFTIGALFTFTQMRFEEQRHYVKEMFDQRDRLFAEARLANERYTSAIREVDAQTVQQALVAAERAVNKAETATEKRFEGVNEFRKTLSDQNAAFMLRTEAETQLHALSEKVNELADRFNKSEGRGAGVQTAWVFVGGLVGLMTGMIVIYVFLTTHLAPIR